jgi:D-alanyl-D-alanine carboxypeptidase/D-alanyl-D-alanine-endopeptidase (penicillin-binding protein 4)
LGADYVFHTRLRAAGALRGDTLHGDLVVSGSGDPFLVSERLWLLAHELRGLGLRHVTGDLCVDNTWMSPDSLDPARVRDREFSERPYAAKLSSFAVNFNAAEVRIRPGNEIGQPATVALGPLPCSYLRVDHRLLTVADTADESWSLTLGTDSLGEVVRVTGTLRRSTPPAVEYRSVRDPLRYSASLLEAFLEAAGISIAGTIRVDPAPGEDAPVLLDFPSLPLRELIDSANRYSNNFMADQIALAYSIGAERGAPTSPDSCGKEPASLTRAGSRLTDRLRDEFGAGPEVRQIDGSGLSPDNRLTGAVLARVLAWAGNDLRLGPELAASLPMPGGDGTLRRRFSEGGTEILRAKTGTMSNPPASGMAGFLEQGEISPAVFVLLMNGRNGGWDLSRMKALQESWVREYLRP